MEGENAVSETPNGTPNGMVSSFGKYYRLFAYLFFCFLSAFLFVCFVSWLIRFPTWLFVRVDFLTFCLPVRLTSQFVFSFVYLFGHPLVHLFIGLLVGSCFTTIRWVLKNSVINWYQTREYEGVDQYLPFCRI